MPYCKDCSKITGFGDTETEVESTSTSDNSVVLDVRLVLQCSECGGPSRSASITISGEADACCDEPDLTVDEASVNIEVGERMQDRVERKDKNGKIKIVKIKNARYMKKFYTVEASGTAECVNCEESEVQFTASGEIQASGLEPE